MKKLGFTLAEVLITLVIIGVIAAMTVPVLMQNTEGQEYRSALKKSISALNQALTLNYALDGLSAQDYTAGGGSLGDMFKSRMSIINEAMNTEAKTNASLTCDSEWTTADGAQYCITGFTTANEDTEGSICDAQNTTACVTGATSDTYTANIWIDVNGDRRPNQPTTNSRRPRDIYQAAIFAQKVLPVGAPAQEVMFDANR